MAAPSNSGLVEAPVAGSVGPGSTGAPSGEPSSVKLTVPSVTGMPSALTVAVKVTGCPIVDGLRFEVSVVAVGSGV